MTDDPRLAVLGRFTPEGHLQPGYGDHYVFFVGRDDCHGILHHLIPQERLLFKLNMFGYDDDELNADIMSLFDDPAVHVQATLDRSQAGGVHERKIVEFDQQTNSEDFNYSFAIGQSETHQISHTKGGILVGQGIGFEGSMNWSDSGEGTGISLRADVANPAGFRAQNNTLMVSTNPVFLSRFGARLDVEHRVAVQQAHDRAVKAARALHPSRKRSAGHVGDGVSTPAPAVAPSTPSGVYVPPNVALAPVVPGQIVINPSVTVQPGDLRVGSYAEVKDQLLNSHRAAFDPRRVR